MIKEYLENRKEFLSIRINKNKDKYEHNQNLIFESKKTISQIENMVDEASKMFSVKGREDNEFNKQEIKELQNNISIYMVENHDINKKIDDLEKELETVLKCLEELDLDNVSRETFDIEKTEMSDKSEKYSKEQYIEEKESDNSDILGKLILCRDLAEIDGKRVAIELNNIINSISH